MSNKAFVYYDAEADEILVSVVPPKVFLDLLRFVGADVHYLGEL